MGKVAAMAEQHDKRVAARSRNHIKQIPLPITDPQSYAA